jgi:hypothetical protein
MTEADPASETCVVNIPKTVIEQCPTGTVLHILTESSSHFAKRAQKYNFVTFSFLVLNCNYAYNILAARLGRSCSDMNENINNLFRELRVIDTAEFNC